MNQAVQTNDILPGRISCLLLVLVDQTLVVPLTAVAEVINTQVKPVDGSSEGALYGWINWREQRIPLLSIEVLYGGTRPPLADTNRIAVFNAIADAVDLGFYAVPLAAMPQPLQVSPQTVLMKSPSGQQVKLMEMMIGESQAWLPNLEFIESQVVALIRF